MAGGHPLLDYLVAGGNMDPTYIGLHQVRLAHHPGIDTQGDVFPIMRNGGEVRYAGWDSSGGGWGIVLEGIDECTGVVMELWHLPEDPSLRLPLGTRVAGDTFLGRQGFSGVEAAFIAHNHLALGFYRQPPRNWPAYHVDDIWWVHPAYLANDVSIDLNWPEVFSWEQALRPLMILGGVLLLLLWIGPGAARADWPLAILGLPLYVITRKPVRTGIASGLSVIIVVWALALASVLSQRGVLLILLQQWTEGGSRRATVMSPGFHPAVMAWEDEIVRWSIQHNLDPDMVATVMQVESCGYPAAVSDAGAQGLFQVMSIHFQSGEVMTDPDTNALRGLSYLTSTLAAYPQDVGRAMAAYNGGIAGVSSPNRSEWPDETQRYYAWTTGIYTDVVNSIVPSPTLQQWLQSGGDSLCQQAISALGLDNE